VERDDLGNGRKPDGGGVRDQSTLCTSMMTSQGNLLFCTTNMLIFKCLRTLLESQHTCRSVFNAQASEAPYFQDLELTSILSDPGDN
jgi:hypothetical protein